MPTLIVEELPQATFDRLMRLAASRRTTVRDEIIAWMDGRSAVEEVTERVPDLLDSAEPILTAEEVWRQVAEGVARQEAQWEALADLIRKTVQNPAERERLLNRRVMMPPCELPRTPGVKVPFKEGKTDPVDPTSAPV